MPFSIKAEQESFTLQLADGAPVAAVQPMGTGRWLTVCPVCGCNHILPANQASPIFTPPCTRQRDYALPRAAWLNRHPECQPFKTVRLVGVNFSDN